MDSTILKDQLKASDDLNRIKGELVTVENETYYKISNCDALRPFFMSIVSDSNHWMFVSSNGGLTAGRKNPEFSLFPYYTDDKITESAEITGSKSIFQIQLDGETLVWEPFSIRQMGIYKTSRNLYKNSYGNKVVFEEENHDLGLTFRYQWNSSNAFGFVKKASLINNSKSDIQLSILDGLQNILPYGVGSDLQNRVSNLVDAYKRSELDKESGLGIYALSAIIVDKAEPSEALKANVVWSLGFENPKHLLSSLQLKDFRNGKSIHEELDIKAEKGSYFINAEISLPPNAQKNWMIIGNVNQDHSSIALIIDKIKNESQLQKLVNVSIENGTQQLISLNGSSDGLQLTADKLRDMRHFSNTLFNIMRGGIFDNNYQIEKSDFTKYLSKANKKVFETSEKILDNLHEVFSLLQLKEMAYKSDDLDFRRLCLEYMPLKFSRRHGDPSRPWNRFSINTTSEIDGSKILDYEGNWRDIFQNWEALAHAYPEFIESMIHKFLNATTFDGYNPYRITKDGFDWEVIEEHDPWSYIGYWGDHQIIYLLKFLEFIECHAPGKLSSFFNQDLFVYANVPYKIKGYEDILKNPKDTIVFDHKLNELINQKRLQLGSDGALLTDENQVIYKVNIVEKILATVLSKISNFIPEGGIWMNTQRPEWNDANNALVGNGVSMVTLCYLRRFLNFFRTILSDTSIKEIPISVELSIFFKSICETLIVNEPILKNKISDKDRKRILDGLGAAGSFYRATIYKKAFTGRKSAVALNDIIQFLNVALIYLEHTIDANKRADHLFHAYNLMTVNDDEISISYLNEMLEGQVAALSSGYLSSKVSLRLLDALKQSKLFREDQYSYLLYPNKELPKFLDKNTISDSAVHNSELLKLMVKDGNTQIIARDINGKFHFNGNFNNANGLEKELSNLKETKYGILAERERTYLLKIFEDVFNHKSFTGRSGTFYGYEGLGSIYWHMISKLQLAVQECCIKAIQEKESDEVIGRLMEHYYEINEGVGVHKSPLLYGAFPTDAYSHTPSGKGAQQPGLTGQVKEDILSRIGELGVVVKGGKLIFNPCLLRKDEFLQASQIYNYVDVNQNSKQIALPKNALAFTYCQVPIIYVLSNKIGIKLIYESNDIEEVEALSLDKNISSKIFRRTGEINQIIVSLTEEICN